MSSISTMFVTCEDKHDTPFRYQRLKVRKCFNGAAGVCRETLEDEYANIHYSCIKKKETEREDCTQQYQVNNS